MKKSNKAGIINRIENRLKKLHFPGKLIFIITGIAATVWFLVRVIPKPSRATYPCMKATAPLASAFVIYLLSITGTAFSIKMIIKTIRERKLATAVVFAIAIPGFLTLSIFSHRDEINANIISAGNYQLVSNTPVGEAKGYMPGRVVWVHDKDATNKDMTNTENDYWYENADQEIIDKMMTEGIMQLADTNNISVAWDRLFLWFNEQKHGIARSYSPGEKIAIKLNLTNNPSRPKEVMNSTPEVAMAILQQLVEVVGVNESDITIGDPFRFYHDYFISYLYDQFPEVNYTDAAPTNDSHHAVTQTKVSSNNEIIFSDGKQARLPLEYMEADYFINIPCLKSHNSAGITICAKNHQGSALLPGQAIENQFMGELHHSFPTSPGQDGLGKYRHLVDYMGHEKLGGNTLINIVDAIWAGHNWEGHVYKWHSDPFNDDYPSSLFFSQDQVAIDAVGYDILMSEYEQLPAGDERKGQEYPFFYGANDYLLQAADPGNWPEGISYDPENDGTVLGSLGVYEHWDSPVTRRYSRNLGTGDGIELVYVTSYSEPTSLQNIFSDRAEVYPNPFSNIVSFSLPDAGNYILKIYSIQGRLMYEDQFKGTDELVFNANSTSLESGVYIYRIEGQKIYTGKIRFIPE